MRPMDADGNFCGKSTGYEGYPYLYYANIIQPFWIPYGVCVADCPETDTAVVDCVETELVSLHGGCNSFTKYATTNFLERICVPVYNDLPEEIQANYNNMVGEIGIDDVQMYVRDIENCPNVYLICLASCLVLIFVYNLMLRLFAEVLAWISIILVGIGLFVLGFLVMDYATINYPEGDSTQKWLNIAAYTLWALTGIYVLLVCCLYYSIKISIKILRSSAKVIMNNMRMIIVPVVGIALIICWVAFFTYGLLYLMSCGNIVEMQAAGLHYYKYDWTDEQKYLMWYTAFLFFWITAFIIAATQYILIVAVVSWYFT